MSCQSHLKRLRSIWLASAVSQGRRTYAALKNWLALQSDLAALCQIHHRCLVIATVAGSSCVGDLVCWRCFSILLCSACGLVDAGSMLMQQHLMLLRCDRPAHIAALLMPSFLCCEKPLVVLEPLCKIVAHSSFDLCDAVTMRAAPVEWRCSGRSVGEVRTRCTGLLCWQMLETTETV